MAKGKAGWFASFMQGLMRPRKGSASKADSAAPPQESTAGQSGQVLSASGAIEPVQAAGLGTTSAGAAAAPAAPSPTPLPETPTASEASEAVSAASADAAQAAQAPDPAVQSFVGEDAGAVDAASGAVEPAVTGLELPGDPALDAASPEPAPKPRRSAGSKPGGGAGRGKAKTDLLTGDAAEVVAAGGSETPAKPARKRAPKAAEGAAADPEGISPQKAARKAARAAGADAAGPSPETAARKAAKAASGDVKPRKKTQATPESPVGIEGATPPKPPRKRAGPKPGSEPA